MAESLVDKPEIEAYYEDSKNYYWVRDGNGDYMRVTESSLKRIMKKAGFDPKTALGLLSEVDETIVEIQSDSRVIYAAPLAGYSKGPLKTAQGNVLVTTSPNIITPIEGDFPLIRGVVENMLGETQARILYAWWKIGYDCLRSRNFRPGQVLALAGPAECGKSLLQDLTRELLGGREAKPYSFLSGGTEFNSEMFAAEVLRVGDEPMGVDKKTRVAFGNRLKQIAAERTHWCHKKGSEAWVATPFWRLTISLNEEAENMAVLPVIDESLSDKIILLRATKARMPMPTETIDEERVFWDALMKELPCLAHWLSTYEIPMDQRSSRFGIKAYQNAELMAALQETAPELKLLALIDHFILVGAKEWIGPSELLEDELCTESNVARRLLDRFPNACGTYLANLAKTKPERVWRTKRNWHIKKEEEE